VSSGAFVPQQAAFMVPVQRDFVIDFSALDTRLLDLCYKLAIIGFDKRSYQ
jgi:hypothetical protein